MSDLFGLTDAQTARLSPYFQKSHGRPRVDDRRASSGMIFVNRNGPHWRVAPTEYGPYRTLYDRCRRWSDKGTYARIFVELAKEGQATET